MYITCYVHFSKFDQIFIFQSFSMSRFLNLLFEPDPYSNEYLVANFGPGVPFVTRGYLGLLFSEKERT